MDDNNFQPSLEEFNKSWKEGEYTYLAECDRCSNRPAMGMYILGRYPSTLCSKCRTDLERVCRNNISYKAFIGVHEEIPNKIVDSKESLELKGLAYDLAVDIYNDVIYPWLFNKGET